MSAKLLTQKPQIEENSNFVRGGFYLLRFQIGLGDLNPKAKN